MNDATGLSTDSVINQFQVQKRANRELTPAQFFSANTAASQKLHAVAVVISDIKDRILNKMPIDLKSYFADLKQLASHPDTWQILDAADPWMIENDGPDWRLSWQEILPVDERQDTTSCLVPTTAPTSEHHKLDLDHLEPGQQILEFRIKRKIGHGTYGVVYLACNQTLGRDVAIKIASAGGHEGKALARLNHENIVRVFGEHVVGSKRILEMQFIEGGDLEQWLIVQRELRSSACSAGNDFANWAANGHAYRASATSKFKLNDLAVQKLTQDTQSLGTDSNRNPTEVAVWIVCQLADALQHAHARGILHQDIKPANVLVDTSGTPLLTDFNVAFISGQNERDAIGGTVNYMSPEKLQAYCSGDSESIHAVDLKSDIYSLGVVLLELLGGQKIWGNVNSNIHDAMARQLLAARIKSAPPQTQDLFGVDHSLAAIVAKSLQPDPSTRYQSASEFQTDLQRWLDGKSNLYAANPSTSEQLFRFVRRQRAWVAGCLLMLTAIGGLFLGWTNWERSRLSDCDRLLSRSAEAVSEGQSAIAAEQLGEARARLDQLRVLPWIDQAEFQRACREVEERSEQIKRIERSRFSSLFGQASLLNIHFDETNGSGDDGRDLVADSLKLYRVMSDPNWQLQSPFSQLPSMQKKLIAENITELMLVSMINSSKTSKPNSQQWKKVLARLPDEHRSLKIFELLRLGDQIPKALHRPAANQSDFESYLLGVWSTSQGENKNAYNWYATAINQRNPMGRERFWLRYRQGLTCQRLGNHHQALIHYAVCLGIRPNFAWVPFNMALVQIQLKKPKEAVGYLERAIALDPFLTAAYVALGALQENTRDDEAALATYDKAIAAGAASPELLHSREQTISKIKRQ